MEKYVTQKAVVLSEMVLLIFTCLENIFLYEFHPFANLF